MSDLHLHPVDWFNTFGSFPDIFKYEKEGKCNVKSKTEVCYINPEELDSNLSQTTYHLTPQRTVSVLKPNPHKIASGSIISLFTLLTSIRFHGDFRAAESHVIYKLMEMDVPYVRVGTKYYKLFPLENRWGGSDSTLNKWERGTIIDDHTKNILKHIPTFDSFVIKPDNVNYSRAIGNCYNLYAPFHHEPNKSHVSSGDIPNSMTVMNHIFGEQLEAGFIYMKVMYEYPRQMLPVLVPMSKVRGTGKSTFGDWLQMIFGQNAVPVNPKALTSEFTSSYAQKNVLLFEETFIEKSSAIEKVKHLTTAKYIEYRDLFVSSVTIPFFGKLIMFTNKVLDFMRIDNEETRFWIRNIPLVPAGTKNTKIDQELFEEIPKFLKYLKQLPPIDFTKDRLVLTPEQTKTHQLEEIKAESRSGLFKELEIFIDDFFNNSDHESFLATSKDIKNLWFTKDNRISIAYIRKVLTHEMELTPEKTQRYYPFLPEGISGDIGKDVVGIPFKFKRQSN
ncbi:MAG: primase-helicase family protein [Nitrososphaerales archaeon]